MSARTRFIAALGALGVAACGLITGVGDLQIDRELATGTVAPDGGEPLEAGPDTQRGDPPVDGAANDAGASDASIDARCGIAEVFSTATTGWTLRGDARLGSASGSGGLVLTANAPAQRGAAWFSQMLDLSSFDMRVTYRITSGNGSANGLAVAFVTQPTVPLIGGGPAQELGLGALTGHAVMVDTAANQNDPPVPNVSLFAMPGYQRTANGLALPALIGASRELRVVYDGAMLSVSVDGARQFVQPAPLPPSGWVGFAATTALGVASLHEIERVSIRYSLPGCN